MNGVVPVIIVIRIDSVPAAIMRLERVMRPANAGVSAGNNNVLPGEPQRPDLGRMRVIDARLDRPGLQARLRRVSSIRSRLRQFIVDTRIAFHSRHVRAGRQCLGDLAVTFH